MRQLAAVATGVVAGLILAATAGGLLIMFGSERLANHLIDA